MEVGRHQNLLEKMVNLKTGRDSEVALVKWKQLVVAEDEIME